MTDTIEREAAVRVASNKLEELREMLGWEEPQRSIVTQVMGVVFGIESALAALPALPAVPAANTNVISRAEALRVIVTHQTLEMCEENCWTAIKRGVDALPAIQPALASEGVRQAAEVLYQEGCGHVMEASEIESIITRNLVSPTACPNSLVACVNCKQDVVVTALNAIRCGECAEAVQPALPTVTLSPTPDFQQITDYLDAAQYYYPKGDPDRVALNAASKVLVHGPLPVSEQQIQAAVDEIGTLAHNLCEETLDDDATPDDDAMTIFYDSVTAIIAKHVPVTPAVEMKQRMIEASTTKRDEWASAAHIAYPDNTADYLTFSNYEVAANAIIAALQKVEVK